MSNGFSTMSHAEHRAIVTGGADAIGRATAITRTGRVAEVVVTDADEAGAT